MNTPEQPSISQELKQVFNLHVLRNEANRLLTGRQWELRQSLTDRCQKAIKKEERLFDERYHTRITGEYKKLMDEGASKKLELKPASQQDDVFDRASLLEQADTNVRNRHEQRLAKIEQIETRGIESLMQRADRENQLTGHSKDAFARATNRRLGKERRSGKTNKQSQSMRRPEQ